MSDRIKESISNSMEADRHLLPYMSFLLQDLWALGSSVDYIEDIVGSLDLPPNVTRVLDLGCGKGAVSINIASRFGFKVVGIDLMFAFLEDARKKADEHHVSHLCQFINQDIIAYVSVEHGFDLVVLASLGGVFGSFENTIAKLRTQVRSGGYMLVDDGYLREAISINRKGYRHYRNHKDTIKELTAFNDLLLEEINTTDLSLNINHEYLNAIRKRGSELVDKYPELEDDIRTYIRLQAEECDLIKNKMEGALWLLQKGI